jgi:hypothetical protein
VARRVPAPGRGQAAAQAAPARLGCPADALPAPQGIVLLLFAALIRAWVWGWGVIFC